MIKLLIPSYLLLMVTCNTHDQAKNPKTATNDVKIEKNAISDLSKSGTIQNSEEKEFLKFYQSFVTAIQSKKTIVFNPFIDETFGVYFIESNGAMPSFNRQYDVAKFKSVHGKLFFELNFTKLNQQPVFEELPKIICDATPYDKQGCFVKKINPLINDEFWYYTDLNEKEKQAISVFVEKIDYTVINTFHARFYFTKTETAWKIAFVDLRVPCEA